MIFFLFRVQLCKYKASKMGISFIVGSNGVNGIHSMRSFDKTQNNHNKLWWPDSVERKWFLGQNRSTKLNFENRIETQLINKISYFDYVVSAEVISWLLEIGFTNLTQKVLHEKKWSVIERNSQHQTLWSTDKFIKYANLLKFNCFTVETWKFTIRICNKNVNNCYKTLGRIVPI